MIIEAGTLFSSAGPRFSAWDKREYFVESLDGFSDTVSASIGAEGFAEGSFRIAGENDTGESFFGYSDVGVAFVIAHPDVVRRSVFFDEVAFEDEGFEFAIDNDRFDVSNFADESFYSSAVYG